MLDPDGVKKYEVFQARAMRALPHFYAVFVHFVFFGALRGPQYPRTVEL